MSAFLPRNIISSGMQGKAYEVRAHFAAEGGKWSGSLAHSQRCRCRGNNLGVLRRAVARDDICR